MRTIIFKKKGAEDIVFKSTSKALTFKEIWVYCVGEIAKGGPGSGRYPKGSRGVSATGKNIFKKGFSSHNLYKHWEGARGHKKEYQEKYPDMTKKQYAERALALIQKPTGKRIKGYKNSKGQIIRYDTLTNDFVKGHPDRGIATMFLPTDGIKYYERQFKLKKSFEME